MKAFILGGGPAGLAMVHGLAEVGFENFELYERDSNLGGLAQTVEWVGKGFHDLGPHKIFTLDKSLMDRVHSLLPNDMWLTRKKVSRIYINGHYLPYPPSPFSLIRVYGPWRFAKMVRDYGIAQVRNSLLPKEPKSFREDLEYRVGISLYRHLFEPIAAKLWGDPSGLDSKLSKARVQTPRIQEVVSKVFGRQIQDSQFEALDFSYPRGGLGALWGAIADRAKGVGRINTGYEVVEVKVNQGMVVSFVVRHVGNGGAMKEIIVGPNDFVFSTLPVKVMAAALDPSIPEQIKKEIDRTCVLNDLNLVFLHIDRPSLIDDSWVFIPDPNIIFHRLSEQESFDPEMTPNGSIVCAEIMSHSGRPLSKRTDEELVEMVLIGIRNMGFDGFKVAASKVVRLPQSYPVYKAGYEQSLNKIMNYFDSFANLKTLGRQGAFNYIGTLDAMDIGYGAAEWMIKSKAKMELWSQERKRTSHYPVLD